MNEIVPQEDTRGKFWKDLDAMGPEFVKALPDTIPVETFIRAIRTAINHNQDIISAGPKEILKACMQAAEDGLLPNGKEAILTVYFLKREARHVISYNPMIAGIRKRAKELGDLTSIFTSVVYEKDIFRVRLGDDQHILHEPELGTDRGPIVAAYAIFKKGNEVIHREVMNRDDLDQIRECSQSAGIWKKWEAEMYRKAPLRRGSKSVPMSTKLRNIIERDDQYTTFDEPALTPPTPPPIDAVPALPPPDEAEKPPEEIIQEFADLAATTNNQEALDDVWHQFADQLNAMPTEQRCDANAIYANHMERLEKAEAVK